MKCTSRHSHHGKHCEEDDDKLKEITPYEEQRNIRRKALHDKVERALVNSGFGDAAKLRPLFTGELAGDEGIGDTKRKVTSAHWSSISQQGDVKLRRSARNVGKMSTNTEIHPKTGQRNKRVRDTTWC